SVGAVMRWTRFFSPLSGIGQMNLPVVPMAHMRRTRASGSSALPNMRLAASSSGSRKTWARMRAGSSIIQLTTRSESRQKPSGAIRARRRARVHGEGPRQLVEERVPGQAPGAVKEHERRAAALREHPDADLALPDGDRAFAHARAAAMPGPLDAALGARSRSGHQWFTQPS